MSTTSTRRDVHGVVVDVLTDAEDAGALVERRLGSFPASAEAPDVRIELSSAAAGGVTPAAGSRVVHETATGFVAYSDELDELWVVYGDLGTAHCVPATSSARLFVDRAAGEWEWVATRPLLTLCLLELLKRHGLFGVHAAGAAIDGRAAILAGASGSGKSTTALALLLDGWSLLGDDILFLRADGARPTVLGFPDEIDASPSTFGYFPSLGAAESWPMLRGYAKRQLAPDAVRPGGTIAQAEPAVILLPTLGAERHALDPVDEGAALLELLPNVLLTHVALAQAHLDLLGALIRVCRPYRLSLGPALSGLSPLLAGALGAT